MCFLRHLSEDECFKILDKALAHKDKIFGVGLDSSETGNPPKKFEKLFKKALENEFITVAHAGEEGPPEYIWEALNLLNVHRIDHGVHCLMDEKLVDISDDTKPVTVAFLPQFTGVDIRLTCPKKNPLIEIEEKIRDRVDKYIYATGIVNLEETVGDMLVKYGYTISTAESCTGGLLGHRFTNIPGSSTYYLGGVVSYSDDMKMKTLGVQENTLQEFGAVSKQTATEMAQGVRDLFGSDLAIAVTGIAGPGGGTAEKPVGLVYITLVHNDTVWAKEFKFFTDRKLNKQLSSQVALNMVRIHLLNG